MVPDATAADVGLESYDLIVQALGAGPNVPALTVEGETLWRGDGTDEFGIDFDGRVKLAPSSGRPLALFALRVLPTQAGDRDSRPALHEVHGRMAARILEDVRRTPGIQGTEGKS